MAYNPNYHRMHQRTRHQNQEEKKFIKIFNDIQKINKTIYNSNYNVKINLTPHAWKQFIVKGGPVLLKNIQSQSELKNEIKNALKSDNSFFHINSEYDENGQKKTNHKPNSLKLLFRSIEYIISPKPKKNNITIITAYPKTDKIQYVLPSKKPINIEDFKAEIAHHPKFHAYRKKWRQKRRDNPKMFG
jgi:hypothetical protein